MCLVILQRDGRVGAAAVVGAGAGRGFGEAVGFLHCVGGCYLEDGWTGLRRTGVDSRRWTMWFIIGGSVGMVRGLSSSHSCYGSEGSMMRMSRL